MMNGAKRYGARVSMDQLIDLCHVWSNRQYGWGQTLWPFVSQI